MSKEVRSDASPFTTPHSKPDKDDNPVTKKQPPSVMREPVLASQIRPPPARDPPPPQAARKPLEGNSSEDDSYFPVEDDDHDDLQVRNLNLGRGQDGSGRRMLVQNNTVINTVHGDVHIGPRMTLTSSSANRKKQWTSLSEEDKSRIKTCAKSRRLLEESELLVIACKIGSDWKSVGNGLKMNHACLDLIEDECSSLQDRVEMMLYRWLQWKCERATVARLTKALYNHEEYDAILVMQP